MKTLTRITPSTIDEELGLVDREPARDERRPDLEQQQREPDRDDEREDDLPAADLRLDLAVLVALLRSDVRRDRERAEADRERLAERDDPADHRQAPQPAALHRRLDVLHDLGDLALRGAHGDRPARRAAHHHALENGLPAVADGHVAASRGAAARAGLLEAALEALHPAAGVDELLLARVERMALGADLHVELCLRRARPELVAAGAGHVREDVLGMDVGLHRRARIPAAVAEATFPPETTQTVRPPSIFPASTAATAAAPAGSHASFARS